MSKYVLLVSERADDFEFVSEVAKGSGMQFHRESNPEAAVMFAAENVCGAIFVDVTDIEQLRQFEEQVQHHLGLFSERADPNLIHFMSDEDLRENRNIVLSPLFGNFFQRPLFQIEEFAKSYGRVVSAGSEKSTHELKNFLEGGGVQKVRITNTGQKQEAVEAVRQYLIRAKIRPRIANLIANAVDELLMNALFDAPSDEFGKPLYSATARSQNRELKEKEKVTMSLGFDGFNVGVSVTDQFGSIDRARLLNHITESYRKKHYNIRVGQAGAGLGIATIFSFGGSLIYHCESNSKTEATILYRVFPTFREFKSQFKFFSAKFYS